MVNLPESKTAEGIQYLSVFPSFEKSIAGREPDWLGGVRREALHSFQTLGFPTLRHEEWRYTDVRPLAKTAFESAALVAAETLPSNLIEPFCFGAQNWNTLVFVDGHFAAALSNANRVPSGVILKNMKEAFSSSHDLVRMHLSQQAHFEANAFAALNTAFFSDGVFLYVPDGVECDRPIHLLFLSASKKKLAVSCRNLVVLGKKSRAVVVESHVALGESEFFANIVTEIALAEGARLEHSRVEREGSAGWRISATHVSAQGESCYDSVQLTLGEKVSRHSLNVMLNGENGSCSLAGLYLTRGTQHVDNTTFVKHAKPGGRSRQVFKGILHDRSSTVFFGKVYVAKDAQKTDAHQSNKNLILSKGASADTRPQLEIFADDVKCAHGAAVGQLDEEMLFYLKSRGIGAEAAQSMLTYGFASEVLERIALEPVRRETDRLIRERFDAA